MNENEMREGALVENPTMANWGPGVVAHARGDMVHVFFRDIPDRRAKRFKADRLRLASGQDDPILDNLPPFVEKDGEFYLPADRITAQQAREKFLRKFPEGFADPEYLGDRKRGERHYKWAAHELYVETLGNGQGEELLAKGNVAELGSRAQQVVGRVNLLAATEVAAFREGLADKAAAKSFFAAFFELVRTGPEQAAFEQFAEAVAALPAKGETHTDKWTVATILPFLARPADFMFVKPTNTRKAADRLGFDLHYDAHPNWKTYDAVLRMSQIYFDQLSDLGPRDLIDVQSFFWLTSAQYDEVESALRAKRKEEE